MESNNINFASGLVVINNYFIETPALYLKLYNKIPNYLFFDNIDKEKGEVHLKKHFASEIITEYQKINIDCNRKKEEVYRKVFILQNEVVLEFGEDYCELLYTDGTLPVVEALRIAYRGLKKKERHARQEINIIARGERGLELTEMEVKLASLNLALYYSDDLKEADVLIRKRLNKDNDKGIVLLHGLPGTGKTTYLRYLIGKIKKRVLFIPPNLAGHIADPEFVKILIDNPESVLIIEDAENILMQRTAGQESAVSNLLNISDGLLSDFLNVQIICTFNTPLHNVDNAILRKGRLIAQYEFRKLPVEKGQALADKLGLKQVVDQPLTLADIFHRNDKAPLEQRPAIGFRQPWQKAG
ncbi:MAG: AAA family ATPase [Chitinophagia bacterium]|nr:AAA family ATPase [Chitinophagia bacterium]